MMTRRYTPKDAAMQVLWNTAVAKKVVCYHDLSAETGVQYETARLAVKEWLAGGLVVFSHLGTGRKRYFKVVRGDVKTPMRFTDQGIAIRSESIQGNLWRAMRGLREFTPRDLAAHATTDRTNVDERAAQEYCQMLTRAEYLRVVRKAVPGRVQAIYRLIRNTGPRPPRERRVRAVHDDNIGELVYVSGGLQ